MKDLWRMDNERGYWITALGCVILFGHRSIQCSEKLSRTINDCTIESGKKHNRNIIQVYGANTTFLASI